MGAADVLAGETSPPIASPEPQAKSPRLLIITRSRMPMAYLRRPRRVSIDFHQTKRQRARPGQRDHAKTGDFAFTGGPIPYSPAIFARCATSASTASRAGVGICVAL